MSVFIVQVGAEIPIDSEDADDANRNDNGRTLLYVFERGYVFPKPLIEQSIVLDHSITIINVMYRICILIEIFYVQVLCSWIKACIL